MVHLLQVILNFRSSVSNKSFPYHKQLSNVKRHLKSYEDRLRVSYLKFMQEYKGNTVHSSFVEDPNNMRHFFMDDGCCFQKVNIGDKHRLVYQQLLKLPIGTSRTLSLSMIISPLYKLRKKLCVDQLVELCWIASFLNTPVRINETLTRLIDDGNDFDDHPYFTWIQTTIRIFGTWQGGNNPRYSSCGNQLYDIFGEKENDTNSRIRLKKVSGILFDWIQFIDSYHGTSEAKEIPYFQIKHTMQEVCRQLKSATKTLGCTAIDYQSFRLSIFTTLISALLIPKPGPHLHQFMLPCKGTASANHLKDPLGSMMDEDQAVSHLNSGSSDKELSGRSTKGEIPEEVLLHL